MKLSHFANRKGVFFLIWKLLAINLLGFVLTTFISSHLRASLNRPSPDYDNQLTYLCTKNSACFLYQLVWVVVVAIVMHISPVLYALAIAVMGVWALFSVFRLLAYCTPGKRERVLLQAGMLGGYGYLISTLALVCLSRILSYLVIVRTL